MEEVPPVLGAAVEEAADGLASTGPAGFSATFSGAFCEGGPPKFEGVAAAADEAIGTEATGCSGCVGCVGFPVCAGGPAGAPAGAL